VSDDINEVEREVARRLRVIAERSTALVPRSEPPVTGSDLTRAVRNAAIARRGLVREVVTPRERRRAALRPALQTVGVAAFCLCAVVFTGLAFWLLPVPVCGLVAGFLATYMFAPARADRGDS
jgi:hypothetical protein